MTQHGHKHSDPHHNPQHVDKRSPVQKHGKWFVLAVVLMLIVMGMYVMSDDEALRPAGDGPAEVMPAAP